jgi:transcriptional regulator with XRE-family HTH domain
MPRQSDLAREAKMQQSRISMFETPGAANLTLDTLSRLAAAFRVGLKVQFVPFSDMLRWENDYSQDAFAVTKLDDDTAFLQPTARTIHERPRRIRRSRRSRSGNQIGQIPSANGRGNFSRLFHGQERIQMRLQFEPLLSLGRLDNVLRMPSRSGAFSDRNVPRMAAGAGGHYGIGG